MSHVDLESPPPETRETVLRTHMTMFMGYAFALAQKLGLSPQEAAALWLEAILPATHAQAHAQPEALSSWLRRNVSSLAIDHGNARLELNEDTWTLTISLTDQKSGLERWGASLDYFQHWADEQLRRLGQMHGFEARSRLAADNLVMEFTATPSA